MSRLSYFFKRLVKMDWKAMWKTTALLKERSPSCGHGQIYDGSFTGTVIEGDGVTGELLKAHGITV